MRSLLFFILFIFCFSLDAESCVDPVAKFYFYNPDHEDPSECQGTTIHFKNLSTGADSYEWQINNVAFSTDAEPTYQFNTPGTFKISLIAISGTCRDTSNKTYHITAPDVADAGPDITICPGDPAIVQLNGYSPGGEWYSLGSGNFTPNPFDLNATYNLSAQDQAAGKVKLVLVTNSIMICPIAIDTMIVYVRNTSPTVAAGSDKTSCNTDAVNLNGVVTNAIGGEWSTSGTGTFSPISTTLNATYHPSQTDFDQGNVTITLTSTGECQAVSDDLTLTLAVCTCVVPDSKFYFYNPDHEDPSECQGTTIHFKNLSTGADSYEWQINNVPFSTDAEPSYQFISPGTFKISLIAISGTCKDTSNKTYYIVAPDVADAGQDVSICPGDPAQLNGYSSSGGTWHSLGTGNFTPNAGDLHAKYYPSTADKNAGSVKLILTATSIMICPIATDTIIVFIKNTLPTAAAGSDKTTCSTDPVNLNGVVTNGNGEWSTSGTGTFLPNTTTVNASYHPSQTDLDQGNVTLTLTSTGECQAVSDDLTLTLEVCNGITKETNFHFEFYPNPASEKIIFTSNSEIDELEIINSKGLLVKKVKLLQNENEISVEGLETGIYFIKISSDNFHTVKKLNIIK